MISGPYEKQFKSLKSRVLCILAAQFLLSGLACFAAIGPPNAATGTGNYGNNSGGTSQVTDDTGKGISGVTVTIQPKPETLYPENLTETTATVTDKDGRFAAPAPEVADTLFVLRKPGMESVALPGNRSVPSDITMHAGRTITGRVFDPSGNPLSGVLIGPVSYAPDTTKPDHHKNFNVLPRQLTRTSADGSFQLQDLPMQAVAVQVSLPGFTPRQVIAGTGESNIKIGLSTGGAIFTGKVVGSKDKAPQPNIPVEAKSRDLILYTYTDTQGTYAFDNMPTGTWTLRPTGGGPLSGTQSREAVLDITSLADTKETLLVLNQGIMLAGTAVDADTSRALPGINITLGGYAGRGARAVLTQADGSFTFENLDSLQDVLLRFDPVQFVYVLPGGAYRDYFDISAVGDTDFDLTTLTIPLHRRLEVKGIAKDVTGKPVKDVEIRLQSMDIITSTPSKSGPGPLEFTSYTNDGGTFRTGIYPPGRYKVWAQQETLVSQIKYINAFTTSPVPALELKLDRAAQVKGLVTNADDTPVTNAAVIAWPADAPEPEESPIPGRDSYRYAKTDATGHFILTGLRGEPVILRATHPAYVQSAKLPLDTAALSSGTSDGLTLKFPAGGEFSAMVVDDTGAPVSRADVRLDYQVGLDGKTISVSSDQYGVAHVGSLPVDRLDRVSATHPVFAPFNSDAPVSLPTKDFRITLKKRGSLIARVSGENPVAGAPVDIYLLGITGGTNRPGGAAPEQGYQQSAQSGVVAGKAVFASLPPGWYKAAFADSGAYAESEAVYIEAGSGDHEVDLTLPKGNHLTGIVSDKSTGDGIAGANVTLRPSIDSEFVRERALQNTTTGEAGAFEFYNVGSGTLHAKVIAQGYPDFEKDIPFKPGDTIEIQLNNAPGALAGKVMVGSAPVEGALLVLSHGGSNPAPVATGVTDASGGYKLDKFPAGSYTLSVEAPIGTGENISRKSVDVTIEDENATQDVQFKNLVEIAGTAQLQGKAIKRASGEPVTLLFQSSTGSESRMVQLTAEGTFNAQLEPGYYTVSLEDRQGIPVEIPEGGNKALNLRF